MKKTSLIIVLSIFLLVFLVSVYFRKLLSEMPSPEILREYIPALSTKIYDVNNKLIKEFFIEKRTWIPISKIPIDMQHAVLSIEDHNFFKHYGISFKGIFRATIDNFLHKKIIAGGSTITQQLAKLAFLTGERTLDRKTKEFLLALQLERNYSKQEILEMYLNQIYFGEGVYGIVQAARVFFDKNVEELSLSECALLAGLIRYPGYYSPFKNSARAIFRRKTVLGRMKKLGYITEEQEILANRQPLRLKNRTGFSSDAPYFIEQLRIYLDKQYGSDIIYRSGWSIYTTIDIDMQKIAEETLEQHLKEFDKLKGYENPISTEKVQGALLCVETYTGQIRVMVGGRNFEESQFNRAIQAIRQPGSAFKPIIYLAALEHGFTPTSILNDTPLIYINNGIDWQLKARTTNYLTTLDRKILKNPMKVWVPENYKKQYYGNVLLRKAIEFSLNSCAVQVIQEIGPTTVIEYARKLGIKSPLTNTFSLALGASDVTLFEMVEAYSVFANKGIKTTPYYIIRIEDKDGRIIEQNFPKEEDVLSPQVCYVLTNLLKGVVLHGTGKYARFLNRPCAGKTGTTNDFTDAWFIGYVPQYVCGVWVGYDNHRRLGYNMTGGVVACPIWTDFMKRALKNVSVKDFEMPPKVTLVAIDAKSGLLASKFSKYIYMETFIKGTEPKRQYDINDTQIQELNIPSDEEGTGF